MKYGNWKKGIENIRFLIGFGISNILYILRVKHIPVVPDKTVEIKSFNSIYKIYNLNSNEVKVIGKLWRSLRNCNCFSQKKFVKNDLC